MSTNYQPKPFVLNNGDLQFLLKQITFKPLFDANGNAIIAWDGIGTIYDGQGNQLWDGVSTYLTPADAIAHFGQSYSSTTDLSGLRDVSGNNNNLLQVHATWGSVDQPFTRMVGANFGDYVKPEAAGSPNAFYGNKTFAPSLSTPLSDYTTTVVGNTVTQANVVDYTPRMISQTITTGGSTPLLDTNNHIVNWNATQYASDTVYQALIDATGLDTATLVEGAAVVTNYDTLLANGGHRDFQKAAGTPGSNEIFIGAENPGVAPTNGWFAIFGQFFDHGLDKLGAGGQGTKIKIALATDDPLYGVLGSDGQPTTSITISRATVSGVDANGDPTYVNHTSPFIDQSQTYGSDEQMTQLLRAWVSSDGGATYHAGMELFDGMTLADAWKRPDGVMTTQTLPTLNELRDHVADTTSASTNRAALTWEDVLDLRNRDATTGALTTGNSGQALLLDMNPRFDASHLDASTAVGLSTVDALVDSAVTTLSSAVANLSFSRSVSGGIQLVVTGGAGGPFMPDGTYTGASALAPWVNFANFSITAPAGAVHDAVSQILMAAVGDHYIAGDGRVNENIALTAIHHVFHEEHNFQIQNVLNAIYAQDAKEFAANGTHDGLNLWQVNTGVTDASGNYIYANGAGTGDDVIAWDQDKMFNAAKLIVEMEYQHAAIDQYARSITPHILEVVGYSSGIDPTVSLEFAQSAFRFGHSTIRETIDTMDPTGGITGQIVSYALEQAFLNPGLYSETGAAAIALGMSHQQMNEVDEFITPALNQGLLGLPLDLAAMNIARGRDFGIPNLNEFRVAVGLTAYVSWDDFGKNMIHPSSLVNFIAAYAFDGDVAKAQEIIDRFNFDVPTSSNFTDEEATAFMLNDTGAPTGADAFNLIDTWMGGLAEAHVPGGLLGSTFDLVFTNQMESLINGDRFYYLVRLFGQQFSEEVGNGQFKDIVERNTGLEHLNGSILAYADQYYDFSQFDSNSALDSHKTEHKYGEVLAANPTLGMWSDGHANPLSINGNGAIITVGGVQYIRDFRPDLNPDDLHPVEGTPTSGADSHEVMVGTDNADYVHMRSGDDTFYGEGGNDKIFGDFGNDRLYGGDGDDIIDSGDGADLVDGGDGDDIIYGFGSGTEIGGFDQLVGGSGNDTIYGGEGIDKLSGGAGDDALYGEGNTDPFTHGGDGNDYIDGGSSGDNLYGDAGDDFVYGSDDQDIVQGDAGDDILRPGKPSQAINGGPDEVIGGTGFIDDGFDIMDLSDYDIATTGVTADLTTQANPLIAIDGTTAFPAWFQMEGVIGTQNNDKLIGMDVLDAAGVANLFGGSNWLIGGSGNDTFNDAGLDDAGNRVIVGGGNDVIIGDSIRLDQLIGTYSGTYTFTVDGATHRVAANAILSGGLLGGSALSGDFEKHFTEMLKTERFQNLTLGDNIAAGTNDTVVYNGNRNDYTIVGLNASGEVTTTGIFAYKITDNRDPLAVDALGELIPTDGVDVVLGVENFRFKDVTRTTANLLNVTPTGFPTITGTDNVLRANLLGLADANGMPAINALGEPTVANTFTYQWQRSTNAGLTWANVALATNIAYTAPDQNFYRVVVSYTDGSGVAESVTSQMQARVGTNSNDNTGLGFDGNDNDNLLNGRNGNDVLNGLLGNDVINGGSGNDTLNGGDGNDKLYGGTGNDVVNGDAGDDLIIINLSDSGNDTVLGGDDIDTLAFNDGTGNNNRTFNVEYDGASFISMDGVAGTPDVENITADLGGGTDRLDYSGTTVDITVDFTLGTASGFTSIANIENATGGDGNDTLIGKAGVNNNLAGGDGDDTFTVHDTLDTVSEGGGGGTDTVLSLATSFTISDNDVENLTLLGTANISGTGNNSDNVITGNSGNNTLSGSGGNDTLIGGLGNDTLNGGNNVDTASYADATVGVTVSLSVVVAQNTVGAGTDTLSAIENLTGSNQADTLTGDTAANVLSGGGGNDTLNGGTSGNDTLVGGAGNDTYVIDHTGVTVTEAGGAGSGTDTVQSSVTTTLSNNVENLTLTGAGNISGTGNGSNNVIVGNTGNNALSGGGGTDTITGGAGTDTITGGAGQDILTGGTGKDTFVIAANAESGTGAAARDVITDFASVSAVTLANSDIINVTAIDANTNGGNANAGNQNFTWIGTAAFSAAGQLRYVQVDNVGTANDYTLIEGNTGGSNAADFSIQLSGLHTLGAADFVL
ncbi:MAG: peroxidase family protein [Burkholderiaceae bacterium]|nr:peroxidase family protein [Burkholderiaceae bacterium]